jgi:hypothetical protein
MPVGPTGQRTDVAEHEVPEEHADWLDLVPRSVDNQVRQERVPRGSNLTRARQVQLPSADHTVDVHHYATSVHVSQNVWCS